MLVIAMVGILGASMFYMWWPYLSRSRDVTRFTDLQHYGRAIDLYFKDKDTIPSNWDNLSLSFCADEVFFGRSNWEEPDEQFEDLSSLMGWTPLRDPLKSSPAISPCDKEGSYLYSNVYDIPDSIYSVLGTRMSIKSNGNYLTGVHISPVTGQVDEENIWKMQNSYKWTISDTTEGSAFYFVATKH